LGRGSVESSESSESVRQPTLLRLYVCRLFWKARPPRRGPGPPEQKQQHSQELENPHKQLISCSNATMASQNRLPELPLVCLKSANCHTTLDAFVGKNTVIGEYRTFDSIPTAHVSEQSTDMSVAGYCRFSVASGIKSSSCVPSFRLC
jgi:hypothetical protein